MVESWLSAGAYTEECSVPYTECSTVISIMCGVFGTSLTRASNFDDVNCPEKISFSEFRSVTTTPMVFPE